MRPLTDEEMRIFFEKMQSYIGNNIAKLIDRSDEPFTFRMIKDRVFYLSEAQMKLASNIGRENLLSIGTCFGKFTKNDKFRLHISCLDYISQYAKVIKYIVSMCVCPLSCIMYCFSIPLLSDDDYTMLILIYNFGYY
jgi:ribosome biogenesis protein Nip4